MALADRCDDIIELIDRVLRDEADASRVPQTFIDLVARGNGEGFIGFWEAAVRAELAADPGLLDS